jgi:glycogen synthase
VNADGDFEKISYLLELAGIPYKDFTKFFKIGSLDFCLLNTLKFTANKFLLGGVAVSPNYAQELLLSKVQKNKRKAKRPANVYIFSGAMKFPYIVGIINGLSDKSHARENVYLRRYNGDNVANNDLLEPALLKKYWENDLNFDAKDMAGVSTNKAILKHIVQEHYRLDISPHKPLFSLVSRIVGQKNIGIFVRVIERIVAHGGQVVIAGPGSAPDVNSRLELVAEKHKTSVFFRKGFIGGREKIAVQAGADFTVITSLYEPAGLTDIEAAWLGTIPIAKRTGGLGKVTSGYYYEWLDNTALDDEADELWKVVQVALQDYRNGKSLSKAEAGLLERFDWQTSIRDYHDLYGVAATYKIIQWIDQNAINEVHKKQLIAQLIAVNSDPLYIKRVCFHLKAAKKILNASEALYIKSAG